MKNTKEITTEEKMAQSIEALSFNMHMSFVTFYKRSVEVEKKIAKWK